MAPTPVTEPPAIACPAAPAAVQSPDGSAQTVTFAAPIVTAGQAPLTTSCLPVSGATFPVGTTTVMCKTSDAKARTASCSFTVVVLPPATLPVNSFLAFGDSITYGEDGTNVASLGGQHVEVQLVGQTYPEDLERELQTRYAEQLPTVTNCGFKGESLTMQLDDGSWAPNPDTLNRYLSTIATGQYGAVLIMEGSNDLDGSEDANVLPVAVSVLQTMVEKAKSAGLRPFLATVPPMVPPGVSNRTEGYMLVLPYDNMIRTLAGTESVPLVDVYSAFGTNAPSLIGFDGLHPNATGYQLIADTFFTSIKTTLETQPSAETRSIRAIAATGGRCAGLPSRAQGR
jgi:lysophospholipase L1-like esterase